MGEFPRDGKLFSDNHLFFLTDQEINLQRNLEWCNNNLQSSDEKTVVEIQSDTERVHGQLEELTVNLQTATRDSLVSWTTKLCDKFPESCKPHADLQNFLSRPDVTEEMARAACDTVLVDEVMRS